jgi:hypothetical protein
MATNRKRGSRWQAQVRRRGRATASKTFALKADAVRWAGPRVGDLDAAKAIVPGMGADPDGREIVAILEGVGDQVVEDLGKPHRFVSTASTF